MPAASPVALIDDREEQGIARAGTLDKPALERRLAGERAIGQVGPKRRVLRSGVRQPEEALRMRRRLDRLESRVGARERPAFRRMPGRQGLNGRPDRWRGDGVRFCSHNGFFLRIAFTKQKTCRRSDLIEIGAGKPVLASRLRFLEESKIRPPVAPGAQSTP